MQSDTILLFCDLFLCLFVCLFICLFIYYFRGGCGKLELRDVGGPGDRGEDVWSVKVVST